jgi:hypothetical protein
MKQTPVFRAVNSDDREDTPMTERRLFRAGDRVRVRALTLNGWQGQGVVTEDQSITDSLVYFVKSGADKSGGDITGFAHWSMLELIAEQPDSGGTP